MGAIPDLDFKTLFESAPGLYLVLSPDFIIIAVSDAYLQATMTKREMILGRNLFEVFPDNPSDSNANGVSNLRASLNYVLANGQPHAMAIQQYDIRRHDGTFEERYWSPLNSPVFNLRQEISFIIHNVQDVTASIKAKDQLKKSEHDFQLLVNNVKDYAIFLLDKAGCVASWNKGAENIKGYTAAEIIGRPMQVFYTTEDIQHGVPEKNLQITLEKGHLETEGWRLRKDGSLFYANIVFTSLVDDRGSHYGFAKVTKDITEKRKDEERIRLLASITSNIQDPVISSDNDFKITRWNDAAEKLLEWKSEEAIGKTTIELLRTIYPYQSRNEILEIIAKKGSWQGELIYHTKSGMQVNVIATASKLKDADGKESGNLILVRDITGRKRAEEKLREFEHFFNNSNDLSCIANREGYFEILNPSFEKVLGYTQRELSELPFLNFVHPDDIPATLEQYEKLKSGATVIHFFNRYRKKDGSYLWFDWNATPNGATEKLYCIARDITDRKKAEDALNKLNEELEFKVQERTEAIKKSERQYRYLFENNPMPMWVINIRSFAFLDVNEMAIMHYGYSKAEFLSMTAADIRPLEEKEKFLRSEMAHRPTAEGYNRGIWKHRKKDSAIIQVEIIAHEIIFEGSPARLILANDVTERKQAERLVIESEENLKAIFDNSSEGFILTDEAGKVKVFNDRTRESILMNIATGMAKGSSIFDYTDDNRKSFFRAVFAKVLQGETIEYDRIYANAGKPDTWINLTYNPVRKENGVAGVCITGRDITERKKSEQQLEESFREKQALAERMSTIINTLPANIALLDSKGNIVDVNDAWRKFADSNGFFGNNYSIGENYIDISKSTPRSDSKDGRNVASGIRSVLAGRLKEFVYEYACHSPNVERWFRMVVSPLQENGKAGAVAMHVDISELRRLERERIESRVDEQKKLTLAILQGQEKERNHLGRELHDNINQILAATRMFLSMAAKKNELLRDAIKYPMELLDSSIEEIRMLCRGMVTQLKNINLEEMIKDLLSKLSKDRAIETNIRYTVPEGCLSDDLKLNIYRIMQEIVTNIQKYAAATKVNVSLAVKDNTLKVSVSDNGKGFNVADKRKGIGISNMVNRMQSFNGHVEIKSSEGKGCHTVITVSC